ncbi:phosphatases II [Pluteus cervinus]|uniref:Phosphatases II n=1 Tax=Pluteus cervinus TaxID=181527 RepID=A0ACD3B341_9AGAR|nr:phosphatases II [Pluteus cervinus]
MSVDMDEIVPKLWLGDWSASRNVEALQARDITSILCLFEGDALQPEGFIHRQILIDDHPSVDILVHLRSAIDFIQEQLDTGHGILVHCGAGISRSPTAVAAYLIYTRNMDVDEAITFIKKKRYVIEPNDGFIKQLRIFRADNLQLPN